MGNDERRRKQETQNNGGEQSNAERYHGGLNGVGAAKRGRIYVTVHENNLVDFSIPIGRKILDRKMTVPNFPIPNFPIPNFPIPNFPITDPDPKELISVRDLCVA